MDISVRFAFLDGFPLSRCYISKTATHVNVGISSMPHSRCCDVIDTLPGLHVSSKVVRQSAALAPQKTVVLVVPAWVILCVPISPAATDTPSPFSSRPYSTFGFHRPRRAPVRGRKSYIRQHGITALCSVVVGKSTYARSSSSNWRNSVCIWWISGSVLWMNIPMGATAINSLSHKSQGVPAFSSKTPFVPGVDSVRE